MSVDPAHADYFEQVIAMTNRNHLIALDGLTGAEVEQPISVWAQHPMRPARSYVWVAGERGDTVYAVVLGGLGEGWVLTSLPQ